MQKYGLMANVAARELTDWKCEVCGENAGFNWSDLNGQGMCNRCGTPYGLKDEGRPCHIAEKWLPIIREYWNETHQYMGLGTIMVWQDYPECIDGRQKLDTWVGLHHPEMILAEPETDPSPVPLFLAEEG